MINILNRSTTQNNLIIRLGSYATDPIYWCMEIQGSEGITHGKLDNHCELIKIAAYEYTRVKVIVSSNRVVFRKVDVKNIKIRNIIKAIAFTIEQSIVGNIDDFHIIILKRDDDFCYVAAVEHSLIKVWLGWLQNAGIYTEIIMPDVLILPFNPGEWYAVNLGNEWLIRDHEFSGFSVQEAVLKKLVLSRFISISKDLFSTSNDKPIDHHLVSYCDVLRIMSENIENCSANFLRGKYAFCHNQGSKSNYNFKFIWLLFLLSTLICSDYLIENYKIGKSIDALTLMSDDFHNDFFWNNKVGTTEIIDFSYYTYSYNRRVMNFNLISLLHDSSHIINDLDLSINSIYLDNERQTISFNVTTIVEESIIGEMLKKREKDFSTSNLNAVTIDNDNGTYDVIFKCCQ
ncbi:type II secretion system protein GspL [Yersinia bercovieri]|uniref:type II secretion system protein GspL n=1 Tax=Yersinia bercovieri TaxID=634 RepID=UPI001CFD59D9|nr:type II secretion system protein GspL [Yersinia bercovieri]